MPASLQYTWDQNDNSIDIKIPFNGKTVRKADIYCCDLALKITVPPFFLQLDLEDFIVPASLQAIKKNDNLLIHMSKESSGLWKSLKFDGTKHETESRREESMHRRSLELKQMHEHAQKKKLEEGQTSLKNQIALEKDEIKQIDDAKNQEKKLAEDAMYETMSDSNQKLSIDTKPHKEIKVRAAAIIKFKHTPRAFKTPMRESTQQQEQAFLAKNRPYLKANHYFNSESSGLAESDPTWLKRKGDDFYKAGDYLSAINVYSAIIDKVPSYLQAITNRSVCYLLIEEPLLCIQDCTLSLSVMDRDNTGNSIKGPEENRMHVKILTRMALAHCQFDTLHHYEAALGYLKDTLATDTPNESIETDIEQLRCVIEACKHKREADIAFGRNDLILCINLYSKAVSMEGSSLKAYSNRSLAYFLIGKYESCVNDCSLVLDSLRNVKVPNNPSSHSAKFGSIPSPGTHERAGLTQSCLRRRAVAYEKLNKFDLASKDFTQISHYFEKPNTK